ncbi:uncharacterized protein LOC128554399 [Mercenaria mercenaria]|uniref:uncharacterized protein LOC128554399 n=1 Tax=Mercenaria mercenaria TaxID=6596 RepID=UPI00234F22EC|nr:uncharacterized protein LOC128554399 [Mercenaria mercenaria]
MAFNNPRTKLFCLFTLIVTCLLLLSKGSPVNATENATRRNTLRHTSGRKGSNITVICKTEDLPRYETYNQTVILHEPNHAIVTSAGRRPTVTYTADMGQALVKFERRSS